MKLAATRGLVIRPWLAFVILGTTPSLTIAQAPLSQKSGFESWAPEKLNQYASELLGGGRKYLLAIQAMEEAVKREPTNAPYRVTLGAAYAARFAFVAHATLALDYTIGINNILPDRTKRWEAGQKDPQNHYYSLPPPTKLPKPSTYDDQIRFEAELPEAIKQLRVLAARSIEHVAKAGELAISLPARERRDIEYTRGWTLLTLIRASRYKLEELQASTGKVLQSYSEKGEPEPRIPLDVIVSCFQTCNELVPKKADTLRSLSLAMMPDFLECQRGKVMNFIYGENKPFADKDIAKCLELLASARELEPGNDTILWQQAMFTSVSRPTEALPLLREYAGKHRSEASARYALACQLVRMTSPPEMDEAIADPPEEALKAIEATNPATYVPTPISLPVPKLLETAWKRDPPMGMAADFVMTNLLDLPLRNVANKKLSNGKLDESARISTALINKGMSILSSLSKLAAETPPYYTAIQLRALSGTISFSCGYDVIRDMHDKQPTPAIFQLFERARKQQKTTRAMEYLYAGL
jgi:hypothetical protein